MAPPSDNPRTEPDRGLGQKLVQDPSGSPKEGHLIPHDLPTELPSEWQSFLSEPTRAAFHRAVNHLRGFLTESGQDLQTPQVDGLAYYPPPSDLLGAFTLSPPEGVRVVILGQDPYHGPGQAHGLAFSVPSQIPIPPSLRNIFKELSDDLGIVPPGHGSLTAWAQQGVFLLNSVLTVRPGLAGSHQKLGWQAFTDGVIQDLSAKKDAVVFILWGSYAQEKISFVDRSKHLVLTSSHPSPLSAYRGFFGSRPFSQANGFLTARGLGAIDWAIPSALPT